jgi:predicted small secreted protein
MLAAAGLGLAACENTVRGAGQDMQETGQAVEQGAQETGEAIEGAVTQ